MDRLFAHSLLVVIGKGGVGKSTVAGALGLAAARRGLRTLIVEVAARGDVTRVLGSSGTAGPHGKTDAGATSAQTVHVERLLAERLHHISIDPQRAMEDYLRRQLPLRPIATLLSRSRIFTTLTAATPGLQELLTIGKVWELTQREPRRGPGSYDLVVLDAPATGHGLAMLRAPATFAALARVGPVARQGEAIASFLGDPRRTALLGVATPEEMPVSETLELRVRLGEDLGRDLALIVVNEVVGDRFSEHDQRVLHGAPASPTRHAALFLAGWARRQRAQIARLRRGAPGVALITLPYVFDSALDRTTVERLSRELER